MTGRLRPRRRKRWPGAVPVAVATSTLLVSACVPASPDADTFESKAALTLGAAVSDVGTARVSRESLVKGRTFSPTVLVAFRYSEDSLGTATQSFTELNPPSADSVLYQRVSTLLGEASDLLARARMAVHRDQADRYPGLVDQLRKLGDRLDALEKQVES
jgi:hypothetical protein